MSEAPLVVYVDDEPANRLVFEASLNSLFRIETFATGEEGLARLGRGDVAVLVTDQRMPGMTGNELLSLARQRSPLTERVVITAFDDAAPILEALNSGLASRYVIKPWVRTELIGTLESCLAVHRLRNEKLELEHRLFEGERFVTLGAITAGIIHDLAQPLQVISAALDTFTSSEPMLLEDSRAAVAQLLGIVRNARKFLTPESGSSPSGNTAEAAHAAVSLVRSRLVQSKTLLQSEIAEGPATEMPTSAMVQVLVNLLVNAAQAVHPDRGRQSVVRLSVLSRDGGVELSVRDNGSGMSPEVLAKVRQPFFTTKPAGEGTGLGLFSCQRLVTRYGGKLSIQSTQGEGTSVVLWIPVSGSSPAA